MTDLSRIGGIVLLFVYLLWASADIVPLISTVEELSFEFGTGAPLIQYSTRNDSLFSTISLPDANASLLDGNRVNLPAITFFAGVPQNGDAHIEITPIEVATIALDAPLLTERESEGVFGDTTQNVSQWVREPVYIHLRAIRAVKWMIKPVIYSADRKNIQVLKKARCRVVFTGATNATGRNRLVGDYYATVKGLLLNYSIAVQWADPVVGKQVLKRGGTFLPSDRKMVRFRVGDGLNGFNETFTDENGIIRITPAMISAIVGRSTAINSIVLYASDIRDIELVTPSLASMPSGVTKIPLLVFDEDKNGVFNGNDYLLAYVTGNSNWVYDTVKHDFVFNLNHFDLNRHYWIAVDSAPQDMVDFVQPESFQRETGVFENRKRYRHTTSLAFNSSYIEFEQHGGIEWVWQTFRRGSGQFSTKFDARDVVVDSSFHMKVCMGSSYLVKSTEMSFGGTTISDSNKWIELPGSTWNAPLFLLKIEFGIPPENDERTPHHELKEVDIRHYQLLDMQSRNKLLFFSDSGSGIIRYTINHLPFEKVSLFRIPANESAISFIGSTTKGGSYSFNDTAGSGVTYYICSESAMVTPAQTEVYIPDINNSEFEIKDLRGINSPENSCDYLIVTHRLFWSEAVRLAGHKKKSGRFLCPKIVDIENVFRDFAGATRDPGALRNYLSFVVHSAQWKQKPDYVLLLGGGNYDYKQYLNNEVNLIPPAEIGFDPIEDYFACVNPGDNVTSSSVAPSIFMGRISAVSLEDVSSSVSKIIEMEDEQADRGAWRNRIVLVSDDDQQGAVQDGIINSNAHFKGNEEIERALETDRPSVDVRKVVLFEYPWNTLYHKPMATTALYNEVNNGVACVNFFGHGSYHAWTDEDILDRSKIAGFKNSKKYPLFNSFSCSVGWFDAPGSSSLAEQLVFMKNAGAIASIASTRIAYAGENTNMSKEFFKQIFKPRSHRTIGQAYAFTKQVSLGNLKNYVFFGDPSISFLSRKDTATAPDSMVLKIYDKEERELNGDSLKALQVITVRGTIMKNGAIFTNFTSGADTGYVQLTLANPKQDSVRRKDGGTFSSPTPVYRLPGTPLFSGNILLVNGQFEQKIFIPRRVTFAKKGASLSAFAWNRENSCTGFRNDLTFSGSVDVSGGDSVGPLILVRQIYLGNNGEIKTGFTNSIKSALPVNLQIVLADNDGLDVTGCGPDEGLTYEVESAIEKRNTNQTFIFDPGKYTSGSAHLSIDEKMLKPGSYNVFLSAQDLLGNISKHTFTLEIVREDEVDVDRVRAIPNPVRMGGTVRFDVDYVSDNSFSAIDDDVSIKVFTLSGRLVRTFYNIGRQVSSWNLRDQKGTLLPPNIYLYVVTLKKRDQTSMATSKINRSRVKKLVILPP